MLIGIPQGYRVQGGLLADGCIRLSRVSDVGRVGYASTHSTSELHSPSNAAAGQLITACVVHVASAPPPRRVRYGHFWYVFFSITFSLPTVAMFCVRGLVEMKRSRFSWPLDWVETKGIFYLFTLVNQNQPKISILNVSHQVNKGPC